MSEPKHSAPGTQNAYAKRIGVSHERVSRLKREGKLKTGIDEAASERMHLERLKAQERSPSRQIQDLYRAKMAKLEFEQAIGLVVEVAAVEKDAFRIGRQVRDAVLTVPDRIAGLLAAELDQHKVHALMTQELIQALEAIAVGPS